MFTTARYSALFQDIFTFCTCFCVLFVVTVAADLFAIVMDELFGGDRTFANIACKTGVVPKYTF